MKKVERFIAENVNEMIWIRLRRLTSSRLCKNVISQTALTEDHVLSEKILREKSEGMAWAVKSGLGYWDTKSLSLNSRILSRYYAILQLSIAEQVAAPKPEYLLPAIQRHTEHGHGLASLLDKMDGFPKSYYVACLRTGHFSSYCKYLDYDLSTVCFERRPRRYSDLSVLDRQKIVSDPPREDKDRLTYIAIYNTMASQCPPEQMQEYGFPFERVREEHDDLMKTSYLVAEFRHPNEGYWHDYLPTYKSSFCGTSIIVPMWGQINDPFIIHFVTLYALSIVVRYFPDLWHQIEEGDLDHLRSLFEHYLTVVDNVLPRLALERLTRSRIRVDQPGSLWAPI